jgi:hypothetical protein
MGDRYMLEEKFIKGKWSSEKAWEWYNSQPWMRGYNGYPSNCVNRIAFWQEYKHDEVLEQIDYEFDLAKKTGFNCVRAVIQFEVWLYEHDSFMKNLEDYFALADKHGIKVMLTIGNDCLVPKSLYKIQTPKMGEQHVDWGYHSGIKRGPHAGGHVGPGYGLFDEPEYAEKFFLMVDEIAAKYAKDDRLHIWDVWNEPGNAGRGDMSLELMEKCFEIIRSHDQIQPVTTASWKYVAKGQFRVSSNIELRAMELSDIISFHCYQPVHDVVGIIEALKEDYGRPIINSEWLNRIFDNSIHRIMPIFYLENIGSFHWGLIQGYSQTYEPVLPIYDMAEKDPTIDTRKWMHDLYHFNGYPYDKTEIELIKQLSKMADDKFAAKHRAE